MLRLFSILFYIIYLFTFMFFNLNAAGIYSEHGESIKLVLKVKDLGVNTLFRHLKNYNLTQYDQLTPFTYILDYKGPKRSTALQQIITQVKRLYKKKILVLEHVREYDNTIKPVDKYVNTISYQSDVPYLRDPNLVCENYYGMGVRDAWSRGYTGKGVTIAITDVGINIELLDLKQNINADLSFNFVDNSFNVNPEFFHNIRAKAAYYTDHGNKMASIIGATKGNNLCSAGIAHNASIVALKIFRVTKTKSDILGLHPRHWTTSDIFARALKYNLHTIDIFANAWAPVHPFDKLDIATNDVISYGASNGRRGLGTIHVVPSGPPGSQLSNNINTITVNSIGRYGRIPSYTYTDSSALTSGLGDGNNLTSNSMVTTTLKNRCVTGFDGVSAATAQVAAILGIGLQANSKLSFRDVQHLVVHSSEHHNLEETISFRKNAAGRYFHGVFGFGLLNASKLVDNALKYHRGVTRLRKRRLVSFTTKTTQRRAQIFEFCYDCKTPDKEKCLAVLEHAVIQMNLNATQSSDIKIALISPGGTISVLMEFKAKQHEQVVENKLRLASVHFWDEIAYGKWQLLVQDKHSSSNIRVTNLVLELYGTSMSTPKTQEQPSFVCSSSDRNKTQNSSSDRNKTKNTDLNAPVTKTSDLKHMGSDSFKHAKELQKENNYDKVSHLSYVPLIFCASIMFIMHLYLGLCYLKSNGSFSYYSMV